MHGKITAWHREQEMQALPAVMLLYLEFFTNECVLNILCEPVHKNVYIGNGDDFLNCLYNATETYYLIYFESLQCAPWILKQFLLEFLVLFGDVGFGFLRRN